MQAGDQVDLIDGSDGIVIETSRAEHANGITVYNFEVAGDHTYFVADADTSFANPVWVHNASYGSLVKVDNKVIKAGVDAHALKDDFVPNNGSRYNIAEDKGTGQLYLIPRHQGATEPIPLNMTLEEARELYPR